MIRVRDSGIGIAADQLPRIFDMFMQVDTSLERSVSGLGIGLTLVKNLVEMHGGTVEVHSAGVGQGSEFVVRLPIMVETPKPPPPEPTVSEPTPTTARRILVVDDNRDSATVAGDAVEADRPRDAHRLRRPRGGGSGGDVPARRGAARHRPAEAERLRSVPAASENSRGARTWCWWP